LTTSTGGKNHSCYYLEIKVKNSLSFSKDYFNYWHNYSFKWALSSINKNIFGKTGWKFYFRNENGFYEDLTSNLSGMK